MTLRPMARQGQPPPPLFESLLDVGCEELRCLSFVYRAYTWYYVRYTFVLTIDARSAALVRGV
jgi:hypothetical protein